LQITIKLQIRASGVAKGGGAAPPNGRAGKNLK